jgi:hypothetical protein
MQAFSLERWLQNFWKLVEFDEAENQTRHYSFDDERHLIQEMQSANIMHQVRHVVDVGLVNHVRSPRLWRCGQSSHQSDMTRSGHCSTLPAMMLGGVV